MLMLVNISLLKRTFLGPTPRVSDSIRLEWVPIICIYNKFLHAAAAAGLGDHRLRTIGLGPYKNTASYETTTQDRV